MVNYLTQSSLILLRVRKWVTKNFRFTQSQTSVASCTIFPMYEDTIVTQENTLDEIMQNLSEAVSLYLEDEDLSQLQVVAQPSIVVTLLIVVSSLIEQWQLI